MKLTRSLFAPLLAAGVAASIAAAPLAAAAGPDCSYSGQGNSVCQAPGNAQIVAVPSDVPYQPWGFYPYAYGGFIAGDLHHGHAHGIGHHR
ncbi:hypothetical protein [Mycolicibacterium sp.]|uniref:hypothetical protein n=1 Tax=Mycolicibacterium sp. TaxID=2320850 RepID=UPI003D11BC03